MDERDEGGLVSAKGIGRCLRLLAEEARSLGLQRTAQAITEALLACQMEMARLGALGSSVTLPRTLN